MTRLAESLQVLTVKPFATDRNRHDVIDLRAELGLALPAHRLFGEDDEAQSLPCGVIPSLSTRPSLLIEPLAA
jgi:hypothetical protein